MWEGDFKKWDQSCRQGRDILDNEERKHILLRSESEYGNGCDSREKRCLSNI